MRGERTWPSTVRARVAYSRNGQGYMAMTIPMGIWRELGWEVGGMLMVWPTTDGTMVVGMAGQNHDMSNMIQVPATDGQVIIKPRAGSFHERAVQIDNEIEEILSKPAKVFPKLPGMNDLPDLYGKSLLSEVNQKMRKRRMAAKKARK